MEVIIANYFSVPHLQVFILGIIALLCIFSSRLRLGLIVTFVFVFAWGLETNFLQQEGVISHLETFDAIFLCIGLSLSLFFLIFHIFLPNQ